MSERVRYFGAGPTKIPNEVLQRAQDEFLNYNGTGISILETSHRSEIYKKINASTQSHIRDLLNVPFDYEILLLQGGATGQFSAIPMNMLLNGKADYMVTGTWSKKAYKEAQKYGNINLVFPGGDDNTVIPDMDLWNLSSDADYVYYCDNETVHGIEFPSVPEVGDVPLVCDMSSNILTRPVDVSKFAVIFAGAQKNIGCAGVTLVIVKKSVLGKSADSRCPNVLDWKINSDADSIMNTPPVFCVYLMDLVLDWIKDQGGIVEMDRRRSSKSGKLYQVVEESQGFYKCLVDEKHRSGINVVFKIGDTDDELEKSFLSKAKQQGFQGIAGHRSVGGIRVSSYNAISEDDVQLLADFMKNFRNSKFQ